MIRLAICDVDVCNLVDVGVDVDVGNPVANIDVDVEVDVTTGNPVANVDVRQSWLETLEGIQITAMISQPSFIGML